MLEEALISSCFSFVVNQLLTRGTILEGLAYEPHSWHLWNLRNTAEERRDNSSLHKHSKKRKKEKKRARDQGDSEDWKHLSKGSANKRNSFSEKCASKATSLWGQEGFCYIQKPLFHLYMYKHPQTFPSLWGNHLTHSMLWPAFLT